MFIAFSNGRYDISHPNAHIYLHHVKKEKEQSRIARSRNFMIFSLSDNLKFNRRHLYMIDIDIRIHCVAYLFKKLYIRIYIYTYTHIYVYMFNKDIF